jgi:hypothetical protein
MDDPTRKWVHRNGDEYVLITANVVGSGPFRVEHYLNGAGPFASQPEAQRVGFRTLDRSDDFNIGAIRHGRLVAILWMDEIVDDDSDVVADIAREVGIPHG